MSSVLPSDSFLPVGGTRKQMIHRSRYVNSASLTPFLDVCVFAPSEQTRSASPNIARRFPYTKFYHFQVTKTIDSFSHRNLWLSRKVCLKD
jgi:hypothetical protein